MSRPVKKMKYMERRHNLLGYAFMLPWIAGFLIFTAWPFVYTFILSFHDVSLTVQGWETAFTGINNYNTAFFRNTEFMPAIISFLIMEATYAPTIIVISFILALLLNRGLKFRAGFRALFFLPVIVMSGPVLFQLMDTGSAANTGIEGMTLFNMVYQFSPPVAEALAYLFENYSMVLWFTGIPIVLFISGLQKIDNGVLEAAKIDSATSWQILWKITVPIIKPIILVAAIFTVVQLGIYQLNPVMDMIQAAIYNSVSGLGLASAFAWVYSFIELAIVGIAFLFLREAKEQPIKILKRSERRR
jgi:ABC-type sugar transport system permease subunit